MSEPRNDPIAPPPRESSGCMTALAGIAGAIMLLPGLCAIILVGLDPHEIMVDASWALLILTLLAIGAAGGALIWWAVRRHRAGGRDRGGPQP
jgi:drug/metabolite transporter (DMT)-like permease